MQVTDSGIIGQLESIGSHYRMNIATQFIRPALLQLPLDKTTWDQMDFFTDHFNDVLHYGISMEDLYSLILAAAHFVSVGRRDLVSHLRLRATGSSSDPDKVLRDMAVNNVSFNLEKFAELLRGLYESVVEYDKAHKKGKRTVIGLHPEFQGIGRILRGGMENTGQEPKVF